MTGDALPHSPKPCPLRPKASVVEASAGDPGQGVTLHFNAGLAAETEPQGRADLEIILPLGAADGELSWVTPDGKAERSQMGAGQIALVGPHTRHAWRLPDPAGLVVVRVAAVLVAELSGAPVNGVTVHDVATLAGADFVLGDLIALLRRLAVATTLPPVRYLAGLAIVFATHVLRAHHEALARGPQRRGLSPRQLRVATEFIEANLKESLTTAAIARHVHLSVFHFTRLFKASTAVGPRRYLLRRRVLRARELLRTGDHRVAEVAYAVGFCDQSHLDRHFRREFGHPPKSFLPRSHPQQ